LLLVGCGLFAAFPAWGQFYYQCTLGGLTSAVTIPANSFQISRQTAIGTFAGPWHSNTTATNFRPGPFALCTNKTRAYPAPKSDGTDKNLYVGGSKPATTFLVSDLTVTDDGVTYPVWTTSNLQSVGLGYVIRWRSTNGWGDAAGQGQWVTPPSDWTNYMPPASAGFPFWRAWITVNSGQWNGSFYDSLQGENQPQDVLNSVQDWYNLIAPRNDQYNLFIYSVEVAVRYVLIQDPRTIAQAHPLNPVIRSFTFTPQLLVAHPNNLGGTGNTSISQTVTITLPPSGSCTTPSVDPSTVNFGTFLDSDLPGQGDATAYRNLNLTFTNCPRINIGYYVHANGKWVDSHQGIVGLPGSTPNPDPVVGNPRGFGIQLAHGTGSPDGSGPVYISSHDTDPNKQVYWRTLDQGRILDTGVTHSINLRARVIRTHPSGNPITPGGFNTSVIVAIQYQ